MHVVWLVLGVQLQQLCSLCSTRRKYTHYNVNITDEIRYVQGCQCMAAVQHKCLPASCIGALGTTATLLTRIRIAVPGDSSLPAQRELRSAMAATGGS